MYSFLKGEGVGEQRLKRYIYICIVHCSLVYQFEHSGKVRRAWFKFGFENFYSSLLSGSASFLCAALMSPQRTKQYCPQIEYIYIYIYISVFTDDPRGNATQQTAH